MIKDKAYWNMHRVIEKILTWCHSQQSGLPPNSPSSMLSETRAQQTRAVTKSGKIIITIIRKPSNEM